MKLLVTVFTTAIALILSTTSGIAQDEWEGKIDSHLSDAKLELQQIFAGERFPNIVVTPQGTIVATWGTSSLKSRRSTDGGKTWSDIIEIQKPGFQSLSLIHI